MKKVVGLIKDAGVEQRSRVKEAVQTAMQDGSLQVHSSTVSALSALSTSPPSALSCFAFAHPLCALSPLCAPSVPSPLLFHRHRLCTASAGRVRRQGEERQDPAARAGEAGPVGQARATQGEARADGAARRWWRWWRVVASGRRVNLSGRRRWRCGEPDGTAAEGRRDARAAGAPPMPPMPPMPHAAHPCVAEACPFHPLCCRRAPRRW